MPFNRLKKWRNTAEGHTDYSKISLLLCSAFICGAVPHVHIIPSRRIVISSGWRGRVSRSSPEGKAGLLRRKRILVAGREKRHKMEAEKGTDHLEGFIILTVDCLVTVMVQKY